MKYKIVYNCLNRRFVLLHDVLINSRAFYSFNKATALIVHRTKIRQVCV